MRIVLETYQVDYTAFLFLSFEFIFALKHIFCLPKKPQYLFLQMACLQVSS